MLASAVRFVPDFRPHIVATDMFTPTTIRHFTGHDNGAVYGAPRKTVRWHDPPEQSVHLRHRSGFCRHRRHDDASGIAMANQHLPDGRRPVAMTDQIGMPKDFLQGVSRRATTASSSAAGWPD